MVFSKISEIRKLKIVKYKKSLQSKINISLNNYKLFTGKNIFYESNKKGKEFIDDELIYVGEYLNGKRNGAGKEFNKFGTSLFEGDYLNGKREEYYFYGELKFEGEFLNGERWNGEGYDRRNNIIYELVEGKGYITELNADYELLFEGEYLNGKRNGKGKEYWVGELVFEGEYLNGLKWNGKGYDEFNNIIYELKDGKGFIKEINNDGCLIFEGEYLNGQRNGKGKEYKNNLIIFEGEYLNGVRWNGKGFDPNNNIVYELKEGEGFIKEFHENGKLKFEGEYKNGKKNGKGKEYNPGGKLIFDGEYLYNYRIKGKEFLNGKLEFEGEYLYDKKYNGKGYDKNGIVIYEVNNGNGKVKEYYNNGKLKFEGEYINGLKNGKVKEYFESGEIKFDGEYLNGIKIDQGI